MPPSMGGPTYQIIDRALKDMAARTKRE